jgi:S1-C subfamily serine protease
METAGKGPRRLVAVGAIIIIVALAFAGYYASTQNPGGGISSQLSSLKSEVTSLQQANQALQSQIASVSLGSNQSSAASTSLYSSASVSVVTIRGYELVTQMTFFGPISSIVSIQGSGFAVDYQGSSYIVTNNHVVDGVSNITITFSDGNSYSATVKGTDPNRDLAVLTSGAPATEFHPLTVLSSPQAVTVGEQVYAIGSPFGLSGSLTVGIVSQVGRTITESTSTQISIPDVIQFSAAINPGNSGGPLLDSKGEVIGITTAAVSNSQGLGFAIPASTISKELSALVTTGSYSLHPTLGIAASADMTYQLATVVGSNVTYGVLVESVTGGGPADRAGIRGGTSNATVEGQAYRIGGDIIISINGVKIVNGDALSAYLEENALAGQSVQLGIIRSGVQMSIGVTIASL